MNSPTIDLSIWPYEKPRVAITSENSLICERFRLVMKAVLLPAPVNVSRGYMERNLLAIINRPKSRAVITSPGVGCGIFMPSETKKRVRKKREGYWRKRGIFKIV